MTECYTSEDGTKHNIGKHKGSWKPSKPSARELLDEYKESGWDSWRTGWWRQKMYLACHKFHGFEQHCVEPEIWAEYRALANAPKKEKKEWYRLEAQAAKENNDD